MDYAEFQKALRAKHAKAEERREYRRRLLRICLHAILIVPAMAVFMLVIHHVAR